METAEPVRIEELLAHAGWLRRLAASLVQGGAAADDLVQDTWMAALEHPPHGGAPVRPWLARIAKNLALNRHRGDRRRSDRESLASAQRDTSAPSPSRIVEEVEAQRTLADLVLALDEPLRTTVVLRYFRGLDASEISRLQGTPAGTVRWRLKQALDRLRGELDVRFGRREAWCLAFGALFARDAATSIATGAAAKSSMALGGTVVSSGTKFGIAAMFVAIAVGVWSLWTWQPEREQKPEPIAGAAPAILETPSDTASRATMPVAQQPRRDEPTRSLVGAQVVSAPFLPPAPMDCCIVGRVLDAREQPIDGVTVKASFRPMEDGALLETHRGLVGEGESGTWDGGLFMLPVPAATPLRVTCTHPEYAPFTTEPLFAGDTVVVTLDRGAELEARVRTKSDRQPLRGATVRVELADEVPASSPARDGRSAWNPQQRTADDGSCAWTRVPRGRIRVSVTADRFASAETVLTVVGTERVEASFELTPAGVLDGAVRDARTGEPIAGAAIASRSFAPAKSDASGRYALEVFPLDAMTRSVLATAAGYAPAHAEVRFDDARRSEHFDFALEPEVRVRGRVLDDLGRPVPKASVACRGSVSSMPFVREQVHASAVTDAGGAFEVARLARTSYSLVVRASTLAPAITIVDAARPASDSIVDAGTIVLTAPCEIEGTAQGARAGAEGLLVRLRMPAAVHTSSPSPVHVGTTRPDKKGRFAFARLPPGTFEVQLVRARGAEPGEEEQALASTTVELRAGETLRDVVLRSGSAAIEGVVVAPAGAYPFTALLTGASLDAAGIRTETDMEGRFRFWTDGTGPFRLTVSDPRLFCAPKTIDGVQAGDRALRIELERFHTTHAIRGRLVDPSGKPIESTYVAFTDTTTGERLGRVAMPNDHGAFEMKDLNDVPYDLELLDMKSRYLPLKIERVKPGGADVEMRIVRRD